MSLILELKNKGFPLTRSRRAMAEFLESQTVAASALEILAFLHSSGLKVNKTTVYRELDILENEGLITELDMGDGLKRYELSPGRHHHHLYCQTCKKVICLPVDEGLCQVEEELGKLTDFHITGHDLRLWGICPDCQAPGGRTL